MERDRIKHVEVGKHYIKKKLEDDGIICTPYVSIGNQLADVLTGDWIICIFLIVKRDH
jgi:hypothetical protein